MLPWIIGGVVLAVGSALITMVWWRVGDQWADDEYKKFGHGGGRDPIDLEHTTVIDTEHENRSGSSPDL